MKRIFIIFSLLAAFFTVCFGQKQDPDWDKWQWLIGGWKGAGNGQPGTGGGTFSFQNDLGNQILIRRSHSEYTGHDNQPTAVHDDLMIIYKNTSGVPDKAIYFDNEGHTIEYKVEASDKSIVFTSQKTDTGPAFRLSYSLLETGLVNTRFEISRDGQKYVLYLEGQSTKVN